MFTRSPSSWSPCHDRNDVGANRNDGVGRGVRRAGPGVAGGEHAVASIRTTRPKHDRGRRGAVAAGPRTADEVVRGRIRRHLLPDASTAASACPSPTRRRSTTSRRRYELPIILNTPTFTICAATILDTGSEEQKHQHISARAARRRGARATAVGAQRRIGSGRCDHPRRPRAATSG